MTVSEFDAIYNKKGIRDKVPREAPCGDEKLIHLLYLATYVLLASRSQ